MNTWGFDSDETVSMDIDDPVIHADVFNHDVQHYIHSNQSEGR